jgi:hypothetical protein
MFMRPGDFVILILLLAAAAFWLYSGLRKWHQNPKPYRVIPRQEELFVPSEDAVRLLNAEGYEIVAGKTKLPVTVTLDGNRLATRLFVDAYAMKDGELYIVKLSRDRQPLELTGSALRDRLLVYSLIYPEAEGVLYVDTSAMKIRNISFQVERDVR